MRARRFIGPAISSVGLFVFACVAPDEAAPPTEGTSPRGFEIRTQDVELRTSEEVLDFWTHFPDPRLDPDAPLVVDVEFRNDWVAEATRGIYWTAGSLGFRDILDPFAQHDPDKGESAPFRARFVFQPGAAAVLDAEDAEGRRLVTEELDALGVPAAWTVLGSTEEEPQALALAYVPAVARGRVAAALRGLAELDGSVPAREPAELSPGPPRRSGAPAVRWLEGDHREGSVRPGRVVIDDTEELRATLEHWPEPESDGAAPSDLWVLVDRSLSRAERERLVEHAATRGYEHQYVEGFEARDTEGPYRHFRFRSDGRSIARFRTYGPWRIAMRELWVAGIPALHQQYPSEVTVPAPVEEAAREVLLGSAEVWWSVLPTNLSERLRPAHPPTYRRVGEGRTWRLRLGALREAEDLDRLLELWSRVGGEAGPDEVEVRIDPELVPGHVRRLEEAATRAGFTRVWPRYLAWELYWASEERAPLPGDVAWDDAVVRYHREPRTVARLPELWSEVVRQAIRALFLEELPFVVVRTRPNVLEVVVPERYERVTRELLVTIPAVSDHVIETSVPTGDGGRE